MTVASAGAGERAWRVGLVAGAAAGIALAWLGRRLEREARRGMVDWGRAEALATERLRRAPGALAPGEIEAVAGEYRAAMRRIVPLLEEALRTPLPGIVERVDVVDRVGWVRASMVGFRELVGHLEAGLGDELAPRGAGVGPSMMALANRFITTHQIGYLVGFMGTRVLGQYDLAILSAEAAPGRLLFVEENVRAAARNLDLPLAEMRTWVALHEAAHAFEFEAHPWLRPYLRERLERQLAGFVEDARLLQVEGLANLLRRWRAGGEREAEHWLESLMSEEQRRLFRETQVLMSLLEGFGDWVMDEVGAGILADVGRMRARFDERRSRRTPVERLFMRVTGLDLKLEQYRRGERFVTGVARAGGPAALARLWSGPEALPTARELDDPAAWLRRVGAALPA
ncbi:MAG: hypothetical protein A2X23_03330 [Chloroflexi bacterium GWC2_73_18]|nr:MAG: hypothetical protein A2X23_03330 [Chloroflexi bacterium GWC2_73_18]